MKYYSDRDTMNVEFSVTFDSTGLLTIGIRKIRELNTQGSYVLGMRHGDYIQNI